MKLSVSMVHEVRMWTVQVIIPVTIGVIYIATNEPLKQQLKRTFNFKKGSNN